jgi:N-acetylglutamate synthase/N-acetylornithine aminotransferase
LLEEKMDKELLEEAKKVREPILKPDEELIYQAFSDLTEQYVRINADYRT